jgi:hypothetical protein
LILRHRPRYWLHGHNHLTYAWMPRLSTIAQTTVINAYGYYLLDTAVGPLVPHTSAEPRTILRPS